MIPRDRITEWYDLATPDELDEMWEEFYAVPAVFESYVHFRSRTLEGRYYGTTDPGFRLVEEQGPWPPEEDNFNIFFFGGSTSFGVGPYWATVASYLQEHLNTTGDIDRSVRVYNFGRSGYQSTQEVILLFRLLGEGYEPDLAVFLDGLNDFCFRDGTPSSWTALQRFFDDMNQRSLDVFAGYGVATNWLAARNFLVSLPSVELLNAVVTRLLAPPIPQYIQAEPDVEIIDEPGPDRTELDAVIRRYLNNTASAAGMGHSFGFSTLFVWQPIPTYRYPQESHLFYPNRLGCHVGSRDGYPIMKDIFERGLPDNYLWLADIQDGATDNLYIDAFHYTAPMSRMIAGKVGDFVMEQWLERAVR